MNKFSEDPAHKYLSMADEAMRKENYDKALEHVRKVYDLDPKNMYAHAYEERILTAMAEKKAKKEAESLISARMRTFIADQERTSRERAPKEPKIDPEKSRQRMKDVMQEIETGTQLARDRLFELILQRTADPDAAVRRAKETIDDLSGQYKQRLERIRSMMIDHEKELMQSLERAHHDNSRKLYRSMVYMMQKLGLDFRHREPLLRLVSFFAQLSDQDTEELRHSALLGIYEDLLRQLYVSGKPSEDHLGMLEKTRENFGITESEHASLMEHAKNELLISEHTPTIAVVDDAPDLGERIAKAIHIEFPKVKIVRYAHPDTFLEACRSNMPDILLTSTVFETGGTQGMDLLREVKTNGSARERATQSVLMIPATDEYFKEAVSELQLGQILQKPFTNDLLMWFMRPLILKASGAPIENFYLSK